jgi:hypothetical protein
MLLSSECPRARGSAGARKVMACFLLGGVLTVLPAVPSLAGMEFAQLSVKKGVLLVASPSLEDPNSRQAVVLIVAWASGNIRGHSESLHESPSVRSAAEAHGARGDQVSCVFGWAG